MNCLCCGKPLHTENESGWHKSCIRKFFGIARIPEIELNEHTLESLATESTGKGYTVPGVQKKLSLHLLSEGDTPRLTPVNYPTGYILKPQVEQFEALPEAEHLVMCMADAVGIATVPHALLFSGDTFAYITKRIDQNHAPAPSVTVEGDAELNISDAEYGTYLIAAAENVDGKKVYGGSLNVKDRAVVEVTDSSDTGIAANQINISGGTVNVSGSASTAIWGYGRNLGNNTAISISGGTVDIVSDGDGLWASNSNISITGAAQVSVLVPSGKEAVHVKTSDGAQLSVDGTATLQKMEDVTDTGLNLISNAPTVETTYKAGDGTIVFTPADSITNPAKLTLNNATTEDVILKGLYTLELNGTNSIESIIAIQRDGFGTGKLTIDAAEGASLSAGYMSADSITGDMSALNTVANTYIGDSGDKRFTVYGINNFAFNGGMSCNYINISEGATVTVDGNNVAFKPANTSDPCTFTNSGALNIKRGKTLDLSKCTTITNNNTIENNGTLILPASTTGDQIKALKLTGDGLVKVGTKTYLNDGTEINAVNGDLDFSVSSTPLIGNGYVLDESAKTLTLTDIVVYGNITLPDEDYTIVIDGFANAQTITFHDPANKNNLTISGGTLDCSSVVLQGNLTIDGVNMTGGVSNPNVSGEGVLTIKKDSTWNCSELSWMTDGGIVLDKSSLTIPAGEYNQFWTEKIVMDDDSIISMGCPLINYNNVSNGMNGIKNYLPTGYSLGVSNSNNTILDANGDIASGIVIQRRVYALTVNLNGGNGTTTGGSYEKDDVVNINAGTKSGYIFSGWTSSNGGTFANASSASTTFTMPDKATTITANWRYTGGGSSGPSTYTLTFNTNGGSVISNISKTSGTTVDLTTYKPTKTGYDFDGWYSDSSLTTKVTSVKLTKNTTVYAKWTAKTVTPDMPFVDVPEDAYYKDAVLWAVDEGITEGTTATTFSPDAICTRAQAAAFLWRASGSPAPKTTAMPFNDVSADSYYYDAVLWAVEQGIIKGTSATTFSPDMNCSRAHIVTMLWRMEGSKTATAANPFTDVSGDAYYADAVLWAVDEDITEGTTATTFSPDDNCTRAQIVTFIYRDMK